MCVLFHPSRFCRPNKLGWVFEGVDYFADVWLDGEKLGSHEGAYTRFEFDITKRLRSRGDNFLAVRVTSPWKVPGRSHYEFMKGEFEEWWDALPGPGEVVFPLGLHRSVRPEITSTTRLEELQVMTTALRDQEADLKLGVKVSNTGGLRGGALRLVIRPDKFTGPALELPPHSVTFTGQPGETQDVELAAQVEQPKLWWTWDQGPQNLYTAEASLEDGCFDNKFEIRFRTQRPKADGRGIVDDFDVEVRNKNLDRTCLVDEISGGQFVLVT